VFQVSKCEPIFDIFFPRAFQWYKGHLNPMSFDLCNRLLKIWESIGTLTPKVGTHLGVWRFLPSHSPTLPGAWDVTPKLCSWPTTLQAFALVASPRLGLQQHDLQMHIFTFTTWIVVSMLFDVVFGVFWTNKKDIGYMLNAWHLIIEVVINSIQWNWFYVLPH